MPLTLLYFLNNPFDFNKALSLKYVTGKDGEMVVLSQRVKRATAVCMTYTAVWSRITNMIYCLHMHYSITVSTTQLFFLSLLSMSLKFDSGKVALWRMLLKRGGEDLQHLQQRD